ncbi:MAG: hypothetical protein K8F25_17125, partial [Fimbriimonadaceae bacterium]|nr:hypothetical protein [Alphaproteobacteria bacterium]
YVFFVWRETIILNASANTTLGTPLWLPQGLWMIGFFLFSISLIVVTLECLGALFKRDLGRIHLLAGGRSVDEEIELETDIDRPTHPPEHP